MVIYSLATDGSSDEEDKFFPVLITHVDEETSLITTSFLDMPVVNEATGENIASALKASLKQGGLDVEQCVAFSSDNVSVMTGQHRGVMSYLRKGNKDIHLVGCPCHLSALAAKTGGKALRRFDVEDFIIDLYYQFDKSAKRKHQLREFLVVNDVIVRKILKHVSTRWLSLNKCIERTLNLWEGLRSYILSTFDADEDDMEPPSKRQR
ncbi:hypothetical protein OYC64_010282 [Pagothenia borchgrevinki]|uniref:Uncharacterized protein n=1 Tax=Pagothenia borchgrevinki TaxID=8213 RepID=A0ABD2GW72_PAGBO